MSSNSCEIMLAFYAADMVWRINWPLPTVVAGHSAGIVVIGTPFVLIFVVALQLKKVD